ncbi:MAG TPA: winged helix-turn-helix domain-containing protein, partial [Pyrinomonadaceae bacterium]|nr:winged helix-turn-helix domain-containing protein [Pyrinomonadaceae bacterium]
MTTDNTQKAPDNSKKINELYQFGVFRLDAAERRLWCEDEPIHLTPKQFDLLFYFVENAGRVAKKSELLDAVWADTYVEETTLTRNVSWLRNKLIEYADGKPMIETVPKLGYRFTAEVNRLDESTLFGEEQIIQYVRGEEIITIDDTDFLRKGENENKVNNLSKGQPYLSVSRFILIAFGLVILIGVGFIIYQNYFKTHTPSAIVASQIVPFSAVPGNENSPAFSPDGNYLAYSWNSGEGSEGDIYVKLVDTGEPMQLTRTKENEQYPVFSPDGKYIAFIRGKYGEPGDLMIIPLIGGTERRIARLFSGNYSISFSPDGQHIAVIDTENSTDGGQFAVYLINIRTGERRRLTAPSEFKGETTPRFSPDGKSLAFIRIAKDANPNTLGTQDMFVVPTGGGKPRQITFDGVIINSLAWDADSQHIYFASNRLTNLSRIWRINAKGGDPVIITTGGRNITNLVISPRGKKIAFAEKTELTSIRIVQPDGKPAKQLIDSTVGTYFPNFSPDGSRIV